MKAFFNELEFFLRELYSYSFETVSSMLFFLGVLFCVYWFAIDEADLSDAKNMEGYMLWMLLVGIYSSFIINVKNDISNKTLELMETMPAPYIKALTIKSLARVPYDFMVMTIAFLLLVITFKIDGNSFLSYLNTIASFLLLTPFVVSVSLVCTSLVIAFKRAEIAILLGNFVIGILVYLKTTNGVNILEINEALTIGIYSISAALSLSGSIIFFNIMKGWVIKTGKLGAI